MSFISNIFHILLYQPLFNALIVIYKYLPGHDFGIAVILLTLFIRLALYPLMLTSIKSQKSLSELQPKIQELQKKYKDDKEGLARETMEFYKKEKINPFGGCLPLLIQLPILIALYQVFWKGLLAEEMSSLYSFVSPPAFINPNFLGIINLSQAASVKTDGVSHLVWINIILIFLVGIAQFVQTKMITPKVLNTGKTGGQMDQFSGMLQKQTLYILPLFTVFILWKMPAAVSLYWLVTSLFSIFQQYLIYKKPKSTAQAGFKK